MSPAPSNLVAPTEFPTPRDGLDSGSIAELVEDSRAIDLPRFAAAGSTSAHVDIDVPDDAAALVQGFARANPDGQLTVGCYLYDVALQSELTRQGYVVAPRDWRRAAHKCADTIYSRLSGESPFFDSRIAYIAESGPKDRRTKRLAIMDSDGANHRFLTNGQSIALTPRFSPDYKQIVYLSYVGNRPRIYLYDVGMGLPKMSMLAFYWGIFPANRPTLRKAVYAVTGYVFLVYFIVLWMDTFFCGVPVSVQWSQEEGACSVFYAPEPFYFNFAMNQSSYVFGEWGFICMLWILFADFCLFATTVYALPLFLLPDVKSKDHKSAIYFTFMLGLAPALICMIRFITLMVGTGQENLVCKLTHPPTYESHAF